MPSLGFQHKKSLPSGAVRGPASFPSCLPPNLADGLFHQERHLLQHLKAWEAFWHAPEMPEKKSERGGTVLRLPGGGSGSLIMRIVAREGGHPWGMKASGRGFLDAPDEVGKESGREVSSHLARRQIGIALGLCILGMIIF